MEKNVIFVDIYGNNFYSFKEICDKYNLNSKTLASRKLNALKKGVIDITSIIDKYILDNNEQYKNDWNTLASAERRSKVTVVTNEPVFIDIYGNNFYSINSIAKRYKINVNLIVHEKNKNVNNGFTDIVTIVDKCLFDSCEQYKNDFIANATIERKKSLSKIVKDENLNKSIYNDTMKAKNDSLAKRVANAGKILIGEKNEKEQDKLIKCINDICLNAVNTINAIKESTVELLNTALKGNVIEDISETDETDSINIKPKGKKVLKCNKPEIEKTNMFYDYVMKTTDADVLLKVYRSIITANLDDREKMAVINDNYIKALKYIDELQMYNWYINQQ